MTIPAALRARWERTQEELALIAQGEWERAYGAKLHPGYPAALRAQAEYLAERLNKEDPTWRPEVATSYGKTGK